MAKEVVLSNRLFIDTAQPATTSYAAQVAGVTLSLDVDIKDVTNMDSAGWREMIPGLKGGSVTVEWKRDVDLSGVDAVHWTAFNAGNSLAIACRLKNAAISTSNPEFQFLVYQEGYQPLGNNVGDEYSGSTTYRITGAVVRDTVA